jgi:hypothetical protein
MLGQGFFTSYNTWSLSSAPLLSSAISTFLLPHDSTFDMTMLAVVATTLFYIFSSFLLIIILLTLLYSVNNMSLNTPRNRKDDLAINEQPANLSGFLPS